MDLTCHAQLHKEAQNKYRSPGQSEHKARPYLKNITKAKRAGSVAQVVEHSVQSSEFKVTPPKKYAHKIPVE
jgi:hypothetical protein